MENYYTDGVKLTRNDVTPELVNWLNSTQHYLLDIEDGKYVYRITKSPEISIEMQKQTLREERKDKCFSIINRGRLWYDTLSEVQLQELKSWYRAWLDVTITMTEPVTPSWLK